MKFLKTSLKVLGFLVAAVLLLAIYQNASEATRWGATLLAIVGYLYFTLQHSIDEQRKAVNYRLDRLDAQLQQLADNSLNPHTRSALDDIAAQHRQAKREAG